MGCEVWEFKKCCFCIPLRYGLQLWVYFKLLSGIIIMGYFGMVLIDVIYVIVKYEMMSILCPELVITAFTCIAILIDNIFDVIFLISAHRKHHRLMSVYYFYLLIVLGLIISPLLLVFAYEIFVGDVIIQAYNDNPVSFILHYMSLFVHIVSHIYLILLVRSEIRKLAGKYQFRFENNTAEPECEVNMTECYEDKDIIYPVTKDGTLMQNQNIYEINENPLDMIKTKI